MAGEWVILKDDEIIAHNKDLKIILELGEKQYKDEEVIISKIPSTNSCFY